MSPRKSLQNADTPDLPTIKGYFGKMAEEQEQDIRRLKQAAAEKTSGAPEKPPAEEAAKAPWLMHPIRLAKPSAAKRGARRSAKSASKKVLKEAAKKTTGKRARR